MNLVRPVVSAITLQRVRAVCVFAATAMATFMGCIEQGVCADTGSSVAAIMGDSIATARQRRSDSLAMTPELSTVRTRLAPTGPAPLTSDGRPLSELAGVNYKLWLSRGRTDWGVGVGTLGYIVPRPDGRIEGPVALAGASPMLSVGLRYRVTPESAVYADASGARGIGVDPNANYVNTKVGMEWKPAKQTLGFEHGAIGMHFDSGYRLALKARHGGLGLFLRGQF